VPCSLLRSALTPKGGTQEVENQLFSCTFCQPQPNQSLNTVISRSLILFLNNRYYHKILDFRFWKPLWPHLMLLIVTSLMFIILINNLVVSMRRLLLLGCYCCWLSLCLCSCPASFCFVRSSFVYVFLRRRLLAIVCSFLTSFKTGSGNEEHC